MSQVSVERTLGKLVTDAAFRRRFFEAPAAASFLAGLDLSQGELDALSSLPREAIESFSERLDHRIRRCALDINKEDQ